MFFGKHEYNNEYGTITFIKENNRNIIVYEIFIKEKYRCKGYCKKFIEKLADSGYNFLIISVISKILYNYLCRFRYKGRKFKLTKQGFYYHSA